MKARPLSHLDIRPGVSPEKAGNLPGRFEKERGKGLAFFLAIAVLLLSGCGGEKAAPDATRTKEPLISGVVIETLAPVRVAESFEATGTVKAVHTSIVAARVMGTVTSLAVKEGDLVEKGQLLLTIDDRDAVQREKAAEAGYAEALKARETAGQSRTLSELTASRYRKMYDEKAISRQEMDQFETQSRVAALEQERVQETVHRAAAALSEARIYRGFTQVVSPLRGRVTEKRTEVGSMAVPGVPLLTVESAADFQAEIAVDESLSGRLKVGTPVPVLIEALDLRTTGRIAEILPTVDPQSRSFTAKVVLNGPGLRSGLYAKALLPKGEKEALLVPRTAIVEKGQLTGLYAADGQGVVSYRLVRIGRTYDGRLEILSGLRAGDRIIVGGVEKAVDGGILATGK
ncbi:MAG: efflux RND transporter periplasmic adaptor subunit [Deltaproteobacteria bacterium]|nr:efflux RND transporter periplasmic adaptor subunit [Deltaproteobacteria bacterium]